VSPTDPLLAHLPLAALEFRGGALAAANPPARALFAGGQPDADQPDAGRSDAGDRPDAELPLVDDADLLAAVAEAGERAAVVDVEITHDGRQLLARAVPTAPGRVSVVLSDTTETRRVETMRRDFVLGASHELKTPAAGMQALAESLSAAMDRDPPRARQMLDRLQHEATRLSTMVRDLLDLARLEDEATPHPQPVDLAATTRQQLERFAEPARRRDLGFDDAGLAPAVVAAPPEDVRLLVANLVENAVRYNRDGGRVRVATRVEGDRAVLEVADTGIGIAEADQARVFERFYRVDKARSRAAGGTGLGLSLVRHAAERNGGEVTVRSAPEEGSTFRVALPAGQSSTRSPVTK
jgi:signal transduction histidine kinase